MKILPVNSYQNQPKFKGKLEIQTARGVISHAGESLGHICQHTVVSPGSNCLRHYVGILPKGEDDFSKALVKLEVSDSASAGLLADDLREVVHQAGEADTETVYFASTSLI